MLMVFDSVNRVLRRVVWYSAETSVVTRYVLSSIVMILIRLSYA